MPIFELERTTTINNNDSYIVSYPYLLNYFAAKPSLAPEDVVCGAHMVYGWMPTIVELYLNRTNIDLVTAATYLNMAKDTGRLDDHEIEKLAHLINNSLVGTSKLLHFISPKHFPIWDSKVYAFVHQEKPFNYRVNQVSKYRQYIDRLHQYRQDISFSEFHTSVNTKVGYEVSELRALELIMYLNAPSF